MVVIGVVGVLALSLVHMELVCGKILEGGGTLYLRGWYSLSQFITYEIGDGTKVQF